jgi:dCMP deaminase
MGNFLKLQEHQKELKTENMEKFLGISAIIGSFSKAKRLQVGAVIVSPRGRIIGTGFNGTPSGLSNACENAANITHDQVIHAELNAILNSTVADLHDSTIYLTHSPCIKCAAALIQVGIKNVIYKNEYRIRDGIDLLLQTDVNVTHFDIYKQIKK